MEWPRHTTTARMEERRDYTRRMAGGLAVGVGRRIDAIEGTTIGGTVTGVPDAADSERMWGTTTIEPMAKATPIHRAATTASVSVSLPS